MRRLQLFLGLLMASLSGCALVPHVGKQPTHHNPFPQLARVAVLPFYNQSADPTVNQDDVARAYYNELQAVPGFEVMPVGVAKRLLEAHQLDPQTPEDFQRVAQALGVDAVVVGSVTEFSAYYPPRMGLAVNWFAANPGYHPIPPGYALPWGTKDETKIPSEIVFDAEFALAREQLKTQTPLPPAMPNHLPGRAEGDEAKDEIAAASHPSMLRGGESSGPAVDAQGLPIDSQPDPLPPDWPDPRGFLPPGPSPERAPYLPQSEPVLTHIRLYHGNDAEFTQQLARYFYFRDDARFGGWQAYLQRSEDFIRFCCYLHVTDMLAARGGSSKTRVVWRWPIDRYRP